MKKSPRERWSKKRYSDAAKLLRKFGYKTTLTAKSMSAAKKKAVRKAYNKQAAYILHTTGAAKSARKIRTKVSNKALRFVTAREGSTRLDVKGGQAQKFVFKKLTPAQRKKFKGLFSAGQFTPTGIFIERPANIPANRFGVSIEGDAVIIKAGRRVDKIVRLNPRELAKDPKKAIAKAMGKKKAKGFSIMVNGFQGKTAHAIKSFFNYAQNTLLEIYEREEMTAEEFSDIFHLRLLY